MKKILITALLLAGITATAQVKVGSNPTTIDTGTTNFQVEGTTTAEQFVVLKNGKVGIGTTTPISALHIVKETDWLEVYIDNYRAAAASPKYPGLTFRQANGTAAAPTATLAGEAIGVLKFSGYNGTNFVNGSAQILAFGIGNYTSTNYGSALDFRVTPEGSTAAVSAVRISDAGNVGIGTTSPNASALLEVKSTTKGLLMPRMTTADRTAIVSPANALQVFDTDTKSFWHFDATALPAPGKWVEATSADNAEWKYDSTLDQVVAKRPYDNTQEIFISPNGHRYNNVGAYDYANMTHSISSTIQNVPRWGGGDIKNKFPNVNFATSDALGLTTPYTSSPGYNFFGFNWNESIITNNHVANAYTGLNRDYVSSYNYINADNVTATGISSFIASGNYAYYNSTNTANIAGLFGSTNVADFWGAGTVNTITGASASASFSGALTAGSLNGGSFSASSRDLTTGNINNITGITGTATHSGTGILSTMRGLNINATAGSASVAPTAMEGGRFQTTNNATTNLNAANTTIRGVYVGVANNGIQKHNQFRGLEVATSAPAAGGVGTNWYGGLFSIANNSTSTDVITNMQGIQNVVDNTGDSDVTTLMGYQGILRTGTSATSGVPTNMRGLDLTTQIRTLKVGSGFYVEGIRAITNNSSSVNLSAGTYGATIVGSVTGLGISANIRGIQNVITSAGTGTGNSSGGLTGFSNQTTHSSATNTLTSFFGINNLSVMSGAMNGGGNIYGINNGITKNSPTGVNVNAFVVDNNSLLVNSADTDNYAYITGINNAILFSGQGSVPSIKGGYIRNAIGGTGTATITTLTGLEVNNQNNGARNITDFISLDVYHAMSSTASGTITNSYGIRMQNIRNAGTLTNHYGLYMGNMPTSTADNFAIYTNSGKVHFGDRVESTKSIKVGMDTDASPTDGMIRYNTTTNKFQGYAAGAWVDLH